MKITKFKEEIKQLELKDLLIKLNDLRREAFSLRLNSFTSGVKDSSQFKKGKRDIARLLTVLRQKGVK
jgi:large subunit ribosomal protein L29